MTKRSKGRKLKLGEVNYLKVGQCVMARDNDMVLKCYVCDGDALPFAWPNGPAPMGYGVAAINDALVPLCEKCVKTDNTDQRDEYILRKYSGNPDLTLTDVSEEVGEAIVERGSGPTH